MSREIDEQKQRPQMGRREALRAAGAGLLALGALALPGAALAHGDGRHRRRWRRRRRRHDYRGDFGAGLVFFCGPCRHRFDDRGAFHAHLHHRHHIPFWRIPHLIVRAAFGWAFYG
jgi:hypothetical protein